MRNLNIAVIGLGYMGQNHARVFSSIKGVNLTAVCDIDKTKTEKIGRQYKTKVYSDINKLLAKENIDAISICLPTTLHFTACSAAIEKKIAVFVEKPICETVEQAEKLIVLSREEKTPVMVGHIERFNPVVSQIKKRIGNGELGKVFKISTQRFSPPPFYNQNVSVTIDLATHDIDIILHLINNSISRIYSETDSILHKKPDLASALLRFKNGTTALIEVGWLYPVKIRNLSVLGEKGMFIANYLTQDLLFYKNTTEVIKIAFKTGEPLQIELEAFIQALRLKKKMPVSAEDGLTALKISYKIDKNNLR